MAGTHNLSHCISPDRHSLSSVCSYIKLPLVSWQEKKVTIKVSPAFLVGLYSGRFKNHIHSLHKILIFVDSSLESWCRTSCVCVDQW